MAINLCYSCLTQWDLEALQIAVRDDPYAAERWFYPETPRYPPEPHLIAERNFLGLHSLLTFGKWAEYPELGQALSGSRKLGFPFVHTEVSYFTDDDVRRISAVLETISEEALQTGFDAAAMNAAQLPPVGGWTTDDFPYLWATFVQIRDFFREAAKFRDAMLLYLI